MSARLIRLLAPLSAQLDGLAAERLGDWQPLLTRWRDSAAGQSTLAAVDARVSAGASVFPAQVFRALELTPLAQTRVVILGQDPYHGAGQAEGLAFSVAPGQKIPPSLRNIFKELRRDLGLQAPVQGSLESWARQGVLLLNTALTVEEGRAGSHSKLGWRTLTDAIIQALCSDMAPKAFMLWGAHAQSLLPVSPLTRAHLALRCNHPSPLSATRAPLPFIGCGHFGLANRHLSEHGRAGIAWQLSAS